MKIAINHRKDSFSERWIKYCIDNSISYKLVDVYANDIVKQIKDCDIFLWHHSNYDYKDALFAKQLLYSISSMGVSVYPDFHTNWHFDDKVGQKYLLESVDAPTVPSFVFYTRKEALDWIKTTEFPLVFKLRGGAGSSNVKLIRNSNEARLLIYKAFTIGFPQFDKINHLKLRIDNYKTNREGSIAVTKGLVRLLVGTEYSSKSPKELGYIYFQKFIPNNTYDTRVVVINGKFAAAEKRYVRKGDFRASGSGSFSYDDIDTEIIKVAFEVASKLKVQSVAFDFICDERQKPLIIEISYGFGLEGISNVPGYWDNNLNWYGSNFEPCKLIIESLIAQHHDT